jgi:hypothetical protein
MMLLYYLVGLVVVLSNTNCTKWYVDESLHLRGRGFLELAKWVKTVKVS